jgi:hypothetical protein
MPSKMTVLESPLMPLAAVMSILLAACSPTMGCEEARFTLAPESRIPTWFSLPEGAVRDEVTVQMI